MCKFHVFVAVAVLIGGLAGTTLAGDAPSEIKEVLLRPNGWVAEWKSASSGETDYLFEDRGGKVVAKINTPAWNMSCEREVVITSDAVKLDGCHDTGITLHYYPDDKDYPFKGESKSTNYKFREK